MKRSISGVYDLILPSPMAAPVVFDSPHSGAEYPADFDTIVPMARLRRAEDMYVDTLFEAAPGFGAALLTARFPRSYIDPNRAADDIDPRLLDGRWPAPVRVTEKSRLGHGLIWRISPPDRPIYDRRLSVAEVRGRIDAYYRPYHAALGEALTAARRRFGEVWHVNCHSMPAVSAPLVEGVRGGRRRRADFVIGDRDGTSCAPAFCRLVRETLTAMDYTVALNDPYKGVELVRAHSNPARGRHSLQLEINRALYMNEDSFERTANFARLKADIDRLIETLCDWAAARGMAEAAE